MRRSSAPSKLGAKFNPPSKRNDINEVSAPVENAARTTDSILGLIAKVKENRDLTTKEEFPEQHNKHSYLEELSPVPNEQVTSTQPCEVKSNKRLFSVVYGKPSKKKHKTWEGDGVLEVGEKSLTLKDSEGNVIGRGSGKKNSELDEGSRLFVGSKEIEIIDAIDANSTPCEVSPKPPRAKKIKTATSMPAVKMPRHAAPHHLQDYEPLTMPQPDLQHQVKQ